MAGTPRRIAGPVALANAAANIYTPPASTIITFIRMIRIVNRTSSSATYTLYVGATGASASGTEITGLSENCPANSHVDHVFYGPGGLVMKSTDFLTGLASASTTLGVIVIGDDVTAP